MLVSAFEMWNPLADDGVRIRAQREREKGGRPGRVFKTYAASERVRPSPAKDSWARLVLEARAGWHAARAEALAAYDWETRLRDIMTEGGRYEIPF